MTDSTPWNPLATAHVLNHETLWPMALHWLKHGHSVVLDVPNQSTAALTWGWPVLQQHSKQPCVWLFPNSLALHRALQQGQKQQGQKTSSLPGPWHVLDGHQTPHQQRWLVQQLATGKPLVCLATVEAVSQLAVAQALLQAPSVLWVLAQVEQWLEPAFSTMGFSGFLKAFQASLPQRQCVAVGNLGGAVQQWQRLNSLLNPGATTLLGWLPAALPQHQLTVKRFTQPQHKALWLGRFLQATFASRSASRRSSQHASQGLGGNRPAHSVILLAANLTEADWLFEAIKQEQTPVWLGQLFPSQEETAAWVLLDQFHQREHGVLITTEAVLASVAVPTNRPLTVVAYSPFSSLAQVKAALLQKGVTEEPSTQSYAIQQQEEDWDEEGEDTLQTTRLDRVELILLHDKTSHTYKKRKALRTAMAVQRNQRQVQLEQLRHWVLNEECRIVALEEALEESANEALPTNTAFSNALKGWQKSWQRPCGVCDRCLHSLEKPYPLRLLEQAFNYLRY